MKIALPARQCRDDPRVGLSGASPGPTNRMGDFQGSEEADNRSIFAICLLTCFSETLRVREIIAYIGGLGKELQQVIVVGGRQFLNGPLEIRLALSQ